MDPQTSWTPTGISTIRNITLVRFFFRATQGFMLVLFSILRKRPVTFLAPNICGYLMFFPLVPFHTSFLVTAVHVRAITHFTIKIVAVLVFLSVMFPAIGFYKEFVCALFTFAGIVFVFYHSRALPSVVNVHIGHVGSQFILVLYCSPQQHWRSFKLQSCHHHGSSSFCFLGALSG